MPDTRSHRGAHPQDERDFGPDRLDTLRRATAELSWLLSRGYPAKRSLVLVGDRHTLRERQRKAVGRAAASDEQCRDRLARRADPTAIAGRPLLIDGYNVLLTLEAALGGGVLLLCRDGVLRDMAAMSRHYKKVEETRTALEHLGEYLRGLGVDDVRWYFDRPISNSGRLRGLMLGLAEERGWHWTVELVANPDFVLREAKPPQVIATADSGILDSSHLDPSVPWLDLARLAVEARIPRPWIVELDVDPLLP